MLVFISNSICSPAFRNERRCRESDRGISQCDESKSTWLRDYLPTLYSSSQCTNTFGSMLSRSASTRCRARQSKAKALLILAITVAHFLMIVGLVLLGIPE